MVKSYQGQQIDLYRKAEPQKVTVADYMTKNLITFKPTDSIEMAVNDLIENNISGAPIVSAKGELVGVISEGDCIKELLKGKYDNHLSMGGKVGDCMVSDVISISKNTNIFEAANMFLSKRVRRFPVLDEQGKLVGQISQKDIMVAIKQMRSETWLSNNGREST